MKGVVIPLHCRRQLLTERDSRITISSPHPTPPSTKVHVTHTGKYAVDPPQMYAIEHFWCAYVTPDSSLHTGLCLEQGLYTRLRNISLTFPDFLCKK